jgi:hypothetical protein
VNRNEPCRHWRIGQFRYSHVASFRIGQPLEVDEDKPLEQLYMFGAVEIGIVIRTRMSNAGEAVLA